MSAANVHPTQNAAGIQRVLVLFHIISLAQAMCSANRIDRTVEAMITRVQGKVDTALNRIATVEGKVGATIDCVVSIEDKINTMMNTLQAQQQDMSHNWTVHREGHLKLDNLKVRAAACCLSDNLVDSFASFFLVPQESLIVVAKDCIAHPNCPSYENFEDRLFVSAISVCISR
jgi:hypothetical protein